MVCDDLNATNSLYVRDLSDGCLTSFACYLVFGGAR